MGIIHIYRNSAEVNDWEVRDCAEVRNSAETRITFKVRNGAEGNST
jgi:hypothetical protein